MSAHRLGKYACLELERRYLLRALPPGLDERAFNRVTDLYLPGTRLRLRRVEAPGGRVVARKLTQKYHAPDQPPTHTTITNLYLAGPEYDAVARLGGRRLVKDRFTHAWDGRTYGIDRFHPPHDGLVLAEVECDTEAALATLVLPPFAVADVTDDARYTGGSLAQACPMV